MIPTWKPLDLLRTRSNAHQKTIRRPGLIEIIDYHLDDDNQRHRLVVRNHRSRYRHTNLYDHRLPSLPRRDSPAVRDTFQPCHKPRYPETTWNWNSSSFYARLYIHWCLPAADEHDSADGVSSIPCIHPSKSNWRQRNVSWSHLRHVRARRSSRATSRKALTSATRIWLMWLWKRLPLRGCILRRRGPR